jgi:tetratricopeptide (TPR) repeat protein
MNLRTSVSKTIRMVAAALAFAGVTLALALASPADDFQAANKLYDAGKSSDAIAAYERIQPKTSAVYFNLGNAYFRAGETGRAVLNYERARRLSPRDPDILANLRFAQQKLGVDEVNAPPKAWQRMMHALIDSHTPAEWSAYELMGMWLAALAMGLALWVRRARTALLVVSAAGFAWLLVAGSALSYQMIDERTGPHAIVVTRQAQARFAPLPDSTVHVQLPEGTEVSVREDRGQWLLVERADGQQGWIRRDSVERVGAG